MYRPAELHNGRIVSNAKGSTAHYPIMGSLRQLHQYLAEIKELYFDVVPAIDGGCSLYALEVHGLHFR